MTLDVFVNLSNPQISFVKVGLILVSVLQGLLEVFFF